LQDKWYFGPAMSQNGILSLLTVNTMPTEVSKSYTVISDFALIPGLTAYENIELPLLLTGTNGKDRKERVNELLTAVGLSERAHHRPDQMSGGEQQRVAIARALATHPLLVLADEPTANLDSVNGQQVMEIMQRLNQETGTTFLFATHDPRVIPFARRVIELRDGKVTENSHAAHN